MLIVLIVEVQGSTAEAVAVQPAHESDAQADRHRHRRWSQQICQRLSILHTVKVESWSMII